MYNYITPLWLSLYISAFIYVINVIFSKNTYLKNTHKKNNNKIGKNKKCVNVLDLSVFLCVC